MRWTPWMGPCWTAGSSGCRWRGMVDLQILSMDAGDPRPEGTGTTGAGAGAQDDDVIADPEARADPGHAAGHVIADQSLVRAPDLALVLNPVLFGGPPLCPDHVLAPGLDQRFLLHQRPPNLNQNPDPGPGPHHLQSLLKKREQYHLRLR